MRSHSNRALRRPGKVVPGAFYHGPSPSLISRRLGGRRVSRLNCWPHDPGPRVPPPTVPRAPGRLGPPPVRGRRGSPARSPSRRRRGTGGCRPRGGRRARSRRRCPGRGARGPRAGAGGLPRAACPSQRRPGMGHPGTRPAADLGICLRRCPEPAVVGGTRAHPDPERRPGLRQELQPVPRHPGRGRRRPEAGGRRGQADLPERGRPHRVGRHRLDLQGQGDALRRPEPARRTAHRARRRHAGVQGHADRHRDPRCRDVREGRPEVSDTTHDVLVVGGGPSGAACAYWLAEAGHDVLIVEKKRFPREKTCGDGLTPRAVRQLQDMGLTEELESHHRFGGLRSIAFGKTLELEWPETREFPRYGYVVTRHDLDALVAERAVKAGAMLWQESEATSPVLERGVVRGAAVKRKETGTVEEVKARYVVVAAGANSRFGRALGTQRDRAYPQGMAIRGYSTSPRHDEPWIESHLDVRDKAGNVLPGYGWIFPVGDGRVNVGVGLLSTFNQWKAVNTSKLMDDFIAWAPSSWEISPETSCGPPTGGRLPMGLSVGPRVGPNFLVTGD